MNYRYIIKELRHHHHRTLVNVLGTAIGIALFVSINAVSSAYQKAVRKQTGWVARLFVRESSVSECYAS